MADSFTASLNLRKPEVGAAHDTWGGLTGLNGDLDLIDAVFLATGLGTSVGLHVGVDKVLNVEGTLLVADSTDTSAGFKFDASDITAATIRTLKAPDADGTIALTSYSGMAQTGDIKQGIWATAPAGWVLADGRTIGSAASGASSRAHADCEALFSLVWTQFPTAPIYTFEGVASTRGANAAADFAANKRLAMFDARGRTLAGLDNMGGTAAGILTGYTAIGVAGGAQTASGSLSGGAISGSTTGTMSWSGNTSTESLDATVQAGGGAVVAAQHVHGVSVVTSGSLTVSGSASGSTTVATVQPTVAINIAVKL